MKAEEFLKGMKKTEITKERNTREKNSENMMGDFIDCGKIVIDNQGVHNADIYC